MEHPLPQNRGQEPHSPRVLQSGVPVRLLLATPHDHGLPLALRDAGFEVIYVGPQPADALIAAAEQEDVSAIIVAGDPSELVAAGMKAIDATGMTVADVLARL